MALSRALSIETERNDVVDLASVRQAHGAHAPHHVPHGHAPGGHAPHGVQAKALPPRYSPTTSLEKIARSQLPPSQVLKLDWNEGTIAPPPSVSAAMMAYIQDADGAYLKWYPQLAGGDALRAELARYCAVGEDNLLVTNGSDDALIVLCHALLGPGKSALAPTPTYEHFCVNVLGTGALLHRVDVADPFVNDPDHIAAAIARLRPTMAYLVSPNNPTGTQWSVEQVRDLAERFPDVYFLVDEAYHEFASVDLMTGKPITCAELAVQLRNVIVTRTFSKAFCLASVRCGYVIAHPATLDQLQPYYNPKSVNQLAQVAATAALREFETYYRPYIEATHEAREAFVEALQARGVAVRTGGAGNFVCVHVADGRTGELCRRLEDHAIYVRDLGARFPGYVRITIGLEMDRVVAALDQALRAMGLLA